MAITKRRTCSKCGKPFMAILGQEKCNECNKLDLKEDKIDWLLERRYDSNKDRPKTIEERLAWIEEWIYQNGKLDKDFPV